MNAVSQDPAPQSFSETLTRHVIERHARLLAQDAEYRAAMPLPEVDALRRQPARRFLELVQVVMEAYADRPAVGQRATELRTDAHGRRSLHMLERFETFTYRELWSDVRALAAAWYHDCNTVVRPGDRIAILGFAGASYAVTDFATLHLGAASIPIPTNATAAQIRQIVAETEPKVLVAALESLDDAVAAISAGFHPARLVVFGYRPEVDDQRETFERALRQIVDAGIPSVLESIEAACARGRTCPPAPLQVPAPTEDPLGTVYYTSGTTGTPKGAMYGERMASNTFRAPDGVTIALNYMPMNHSFGRAQVWRALAVGGTCYFAAKSDLSSFFDDLRIIRPTMLNLIPRVCEMIYQRYRAELAAPESGADPQAALRTIREEVLGGRLMNAPFGSAPMTAELHDFIQRCLDLPVRNNYGTTELSGVSVDGKISRPPVIDFKLVDVPELGYFSTDKPHPRGELLVKSATVMQGYYRRPKETAEAFDADGYYRTGDVMALVAPDRIEYVDRRNNVQKLAQGEFVAIARLETTFTTGSRLVHQIYLYGTSVRSFLLAVIVPDREAMHAMGLSFGDVPALKAALRRALQQIARDAELNAYEVPRDFLLEPEPFTVENGLLTGIAKHKRPALKERYGARLEALYDTIGAMQDAELQTLRAEGRSLPVLETVTRAVQATLGVEALDTSRPISFAELGGDSLSALSLSMLLEEIYGFDVPVGVITHPSGSLGQLAGYIQSACDGKARPTVASVHGRSVEQVRASDLTLERFLDAPTLEAAATVPPPRPGAPRTVLVTGANGYLGRFLCLEWLERVAATGGKVICVIRARDAAEARQRLLGVFDSGDPELLRHVTALAQRYLEVLAGDLAEPHLGLASVDWQRLCNEVDLIVHPAALVNHVLPYAQLFGPNVVGTAELIRLALTARMKRFVNVSTMAVSFVGHDGPLDEAADVRVGVPSRPLIGNGYADGYATSKWAAEVLLREAHERYGLPVATFRSDMILAHRRYAGQLNVPDMFTRWVFSLVTTGLAPRSFYTSTVGSTAPPHYDGLPVDFTAASIVSLGEHARSGYHTLHVINPHDDGISMDTFVDWMIEAGHRIERIADYGTWLERFETALRGLPEKQRQHSFLPLLHQLKSPMSATAGSRVSAARFRAAVQEGGAGPDHDIPHLSRALIEKYLRDLQVVGLCQG